MPVVKCSDGKWRIGSGPCVYKTKEAADRAYKAYLFKVGGEEMDFEKVIDQAISESTGTILDILADQVFEDHQHEMTKAARARYKRVKAHSRPGSGARFKALTGPGGVSPAVAAKIGFKKYGKAKMLAMAKAGRKKKGR